MLTIHRMRTNQELTLTMADSCMPTALNHYFGRALFSSMDDFLWTQTRHIERHHKVAIRDLDSHLLLSVRIGRQYYRKRILFNGGRLPRQQFPILLPRGHARAILHYRTTCAPQMDHVEAIELHDGKPFYLQYAENGNHDMDLLPYTGVTMGEYIERVHLRRDGELYLNLFIYQRSY
jgi:hypothetical protein